MKFKVIVRDPEQGTETYVEGLTKEGAIDEAEKQCADKAKRVYIAWTGDDGKEGYLNRDGGMDCPGEPW